ncbi:MAG: DUF2946 family protein [Candidatus Eiseniibacteriota bacterium]
MKRRLAIGLLSLALAISNLTAAVHHHAAFAENERNSSGAPHAPSHADACAICTVLHAPAVASEPVLGPSAPRLHAPLAPLDLESAPHHSLVHLAPSRAPPSA